MPNNSTDSLLQNQLKYCKEILNRLKRSSNSVPFKEPVDASQVPDYYEVIKNPMDLSTMKSKNYENTESFKSDFKLMINNAIIYNEEESYVAKCAMDLNRLFDTLFTQMPKEKGSKSESDKFAHQILDSLLKTKHRKVTWPFLEPVNTEIIVDYDKFISHPMDFSTMQNKDYKTNEEVLNDLNLIVDNAMTYNAEGTEVHKCASELKNLITVTISNLLDSENNSSNLQEKLNTIKSKIAELEKEAEAIEAKLGKTKHFTTAEKIKLANKISETKGAFDSHISKIIRRYGKNIDFETETVEIDLNLLSNKACEEIEACLMNNDENISESM